MNASTTAEQPSRFFKSGQRGSVAREGYKCLSTFNYGDYSDESGMPFGGLLFVNDVAIGPENAVFFNRDEKVQDIILPLTGSLVCKNLSGQKHNINPGHIAFLDPGTGHPCEIQNDYEQEWISYLHLGLKTKAPAIRQKVVVQSVDLIATNTFAALAIADHIPGSFGSMGVFTGGTKGNYELKQANNGLFAYVISGAFEVGSRQMDPHDSLALWNTVNAEFEALSENAMLLILEVPIGKL